MFNPPTKIKIDVSPGKGLGVFATEKIYKDEIIEECPVFGIGELSNDANKIFHNYKFSYPKSRYEENVIAWGYGSLYNHSNNPNCDWSEHPYHRGFRFISLRDIEEGEEILIYYGGKDYWRNKRSHIKIVNTEEDIEKTYTLFCIDNEQVKLNNIEDVVIYTIIDSPQEFEKRGINIIPTLIISDSYGYEIERVWGDKIFNLNQS